MKAVIITAVWCPSCLIMIGRYRELRKKYPNIEFSEHDYDTDKTVVSQYQIGKILPVLVLLSEDQEVARFIGEKSLKEITKKIETLVHD